ncbi:MAG: hypothetical protein RBR24_00550 [Candidatus Carbobacillus sp.]|nr:hypothetical protein [Candidatus Carbobacillus sp.]
MKQIRRFSLITVMSVWLWSGFEVSTFFPWAAFKLNEHTLKEVCSLLQSSHMVAVVTVDNTMEKAHTGEKINHRNLVRIRQPIHLKEILYVSATPPRRTVTLQTYALEPPPAVTDPLNARYPGAYAEGTYVMFLRTLDDEIYETVEGWKGVYPLIQNRLVALEGFGIEALMGMSKDTFIDVLKQCQRQH